MRRYDSPYLSDWFVIALRWLSLLALILGLPKANWLVYLGVILWALWNMALSVMAGLNRRLSRHRLVSLLADIGLALWIFLAQGGAFGACWWVSIIPLITAGIYFEIKGALLTGLALSILQAPFVYWQTSARAWKFLLPFFAVFNLGFGALFGFLGRNIFAELHRTYQMRLKREAERQRMESERLRMVYELTTTLTSTLSYKQVLESILDLAASALNPNDELAVASAFSGIVLLFSDGILTVGSGRRLTTADWRVRLPAAAGALAETLESGEPILLDSVLKDPELSRFSILHACHSIYLIPLRIGFDIFGVLVFAHTEEGFFTPKRREVLDILGQQALIAIKNAKLYEDLLTEKEHLAQVQEEARNKLARDLHDGPTQSVSAIAMRLNFVRMMLKKQPEAVPDELEKLENLARRATKELRHMLFTLRPLVLETQGLTAALEAMANKMRETYDQNVLIEVEPHLEELLEKGKQGIIFFIAEEAVNNARKHARAAHIWVKLQDLGKDIILLEIADDGVGFDLKSVMGTYESRGSLGMINLRERTELINGLLHIDSAPNQGTRVQVFIPVTEEAADRLQHARLE